jgi:hypothetical protein
MTRLPYRKYLAVTLASAALLALFLWLITPQRWFSFYGPASTLLAAILPLSYLLWQRLPIIDWHRGWTFVFAIPALTLAAIQIGFWTLFFTYGTTNPTFGVARGMVQMYVGPYLPLLGLMLAAAWGWLFWRSADERP